MIRTGMWVTLTSGSNCLRAHSTRSLRVNPKRVSSRQESSTSPGSWARTASSSASAGWGSITSPTESIPYSERTDIVTSTRARAASRSSPASISWPAAGWFWGAATATAETLSRRSWTALISLRPPATSLRKISSGRGLLRPAALAHVVAPAFAGSGWETSAPSPAMIAWRAPGTPYS